MNIFEKVILWKLKLLTKLLIKLKKPKVVAVTGSVGKTSTKAVVAEVLKTKYRVMCHDKSYNTKIGLPLSVFGLDSPRNIKNPFSWIKIFLETIPKFFNYPYDVLVLEMGADHPGEIDYLTKLVKPDIGIVIAAQKVHTELFKTQDAVLKEKSILALRAKKAVINIDEDNLHKELIPRLVEATTYGQNPAADYSISNIERSDTGTLTFTLNNLDKNHIIKTSTVSKERLLSYSAAAAVASLLKVSSRDIKTSLERIASTKGRMSSLLGKKDSLIIDDSYNSSPKAVVAGLNNVYEMKGRKIAILGNMNELGDYEQEAHEIVGKACRRLDMLVTVGESAEKYTATSANKAGLARSKVYSFDSPVAAGNFVLTQLGSGDIVFVKGSQSRVFSEEAVKILLRNKEDIQKLVRQEPQWIKIKKRQFKDFK